MTTIIKLTNEYASNLNCLFINANSDISEYIDLFSYVFQDCVFIKLESTKNYTYFSSVDIVILNIHDHHKDFSKVEMKELILKIRKYNELLPVYVLDKCFKNKNLTDMINSCYLLDGAIPMPFNGDGIYTFLYRILKRIITYKYLEKHVDILEKEVLENFTDNKLVCNKEEEILNSSKSTKLIDDSRQKDIRFTQNHKVTAQDFTQTLDNSIIDKIETLSDNFNSFIEIIYDFEDTTDSKISYEMLIKVKNIVDECYFVIDTLSVFNITARALSSLSDFLKNLTHENLDDLDKKHLLSTMLLAVINDLEKWINVIFIEKTTDDIHYLDASFSSNILEIENIYVENESCDEDDLEFF